MKERGLVDDVVKGPLSPTAGGTAALRPVGVDGATITGGFWAERLAANAAVSIPQGWDQLHRAGNVGNLERAAGGGTGEAVGDVFADSDVYKWLEAVAWEIARTGDEALLERQRELTRLVAAAQAEDGYLDSVVQLRGIARYSELGWTHELYCAGHLVQAAVAQRRGTGDTALLDVAVRLADHLVATFGPDGSHELDGHPEIETALVELYRETGTRAYLDLAGWFVDARGRGTVAAYGRDSTYFSDRVPVREATTVEGHAVRAVYLAEGAADVAIETGEDELLAAVARQFAAMVGTKQYVTGGLGARWEGEAFGDPYELPSDRAYAESCAAIGGLQWAHRMLVATGDERYADQVERMLLNGMLPGVSLAGGEFFYVNALQVRNGAEPDDQRNPVNGRLGWFSTACCPPNIMRTLSSLGAYVATTGVDGDSLQVHQYVQGTVRGAGLVLDVETDFPRDGRVLVTVRSAPEGEAELGLRVPGWASGATLDGEPVEPGLARRRRLWSAGDRLELVLPTAPRLIAADDRIDGIRDSVAIAAGPLVFAVEQVDLPVGAQVDDLHLDVDAPLRLGGSDAALAAPVVLASGWVHRHVERPEPYAALGGGEDDGVEREPVPIRAVPYFAWANRGADAMRVWIPAG
ncbi:glycoside hydrolase family 127 protein [Amnibacterium setariae]|uniref:Glycoside hydrolase family 127 protein n=1 Tax=Amnibacterium setariae TaxID=2306585 RepID=A0A3A1TUP9_9MICO|nr:glycoside hydrolase family 127 protein [Amnibacterium setariae]